jgi:hypothetical protein
MYQEKSGNTGPGETLFAKGLLMMFLALMVDISIHFQSKTFSRWSASRPWLHGTRAVEDFWTMYISHSTNVIKGEF